MTTEMPLPPTEELLEQRRNAIRYSSTITGLDYIKYAIVNNKPQLQLYFITKNSSTIKATPDGVTKDDVSITVKTPGTSTTVFVINAVIDSSTNDNLLVVDLTGTQIQTGDNSIYTLALPLNNVDIFLSQADFSIAGNVQAQFDTLQSTITTLSKLPSTPEIDYLSRDYLSFRQLMLNRLSVLISDWQADNPADLGSVIIEILAYAADYLSYYQDAVSTEAYLDTARLRISVKRHSRLLDYNLSEGCNARVWAHIDVVDDISLPANTLLISRSSAPKGAIAINSDTYQTVINEGGVTFATLYPVSLIAEHNLIDFYSWGSRQLSLPAGTTKASLLGAFSTLQPGDVLVFEQVKSPNTGLAEDADPTQRCVVRLTQVEITLDKLSPDNPQALNAVTEITWYDEDALPFEMVISKIINGNEVSGISQVRGNMVLADQGEFIQNDPLTPTVVASQGVYRPTLSRQNITFSEPFSLEAFKQQPASKATIQNPRNAQPVISLLQDKVNEWDVDSDLLDSNYLSQNFVAEIEESRQVFLRFGDGTFGKLPTPGSTFTANYRIGNGSSGNIGADSIAYIIVDPSLTLAISDVTNPLPAQGGIDPETITQAKLFAPKAFQQQQRCVTVEDYIQITNQYPRIIHTNAILRWTGSWNTVFIAIQLSGGGNFSDSFKQGLLDYLHKYKLLHHDLEIISPQWVPLDIKLPITLSSGYSFNTVNQSLMQCFSSKILPEGSKGFFYPDNFTFGQTLYLSDIVVAAVAIPGVASIDITTDNGAIFQRFNDNSNTALIAQQISVNPLEIIQVLNNPDIPELGRIQFTLPSETTP